MKFYHKLVGLKTRKHYWNSLKILVPIRNFLNLPPKPHVATMEGWNEWKAQSEQASKFWYWVIENLTIKLQNFVLFVPDVYNNIKYLLKLRFKRQYYLIDTKLNKYEYHEIDTRMLHGMFALLDQYVDELSNRYSEKSGLDYLDWEISNTTDAQASVARTVKELYLWWHEIRPNRKDTYDESGLATFFSKYESFNIPKDPTIQAEYAKMSEKQTELEQQHFQEDTEMLIKLIKIRDALWT